MAPAPVQQSALFIERLHNHYLVSAEHQAPEEVRRLCEAAIASTLPQALINALSRSLPFRDPGLWFIRQLEVDFAINPEINAHLAETWAGEIAGALLPALQTGEDAGIVYFPDRAAYLASFLLDLSEKSAWGKWYYAGFEG